MNLRLFELGHSYSIYFACHKAEQNAVGRISYTRSDKILTTGSPHHGIE